MTITKIDTTHSEYSVSALNDIQLEDYIEVVEGLVVTGSTSGTSGSSGINGTSGSSGISPVITLLSITGETTLTDTNIYVRATGGTYIVYLPVSTGSLETITIKNLTSNEKTVTANGADLIDGAGTKALSTLNSSIVLTDSVVGYWDIN